MATSKKSLRKPPSRAELDTTKLRQRYIIGSSGVSKGKKK